MGRSPARQAMALVVAVLVATAMTIAATPGAAVAARAPALTLVGTAVYDVQPQQHRVHVTLALVVTNRTHETVTTRFVYDHANLAVLPGTTGFLATNNGSKVAVTVVSRSSRSTLLAIRFAKRLTSGHSTNLRLVFDLADPGGSPARRVRVGDALVTFPVWAFGTTGTPGSSVSVQFPTGYQVQVVAGQLVPAVTAADGTVSLTSAVLADPFKLSAYVVADRPAAFDQRPLVVAVGGRPASLVVRAWGDDAAWGRRVAGVLRVGLPVLGGLIGMPYPWTAPIGVEETIGRSIGGYAGVFDPASSTIRVAYDADPAVVLHEAAHLWFNGRLFADRWIVEGFATWAGEGAGSQLKLAGRPVALDATLRAAAMPLNAWPTPTAGQAAGPGEAYAYAASTDLARRIAALAGPRGLQATFVAAANHESAYDPAGSRSGSSQNASGTAGASGEQSSTDWRGLLDLLAERAGVDATALWRRWVVRPQELALLDGRAAARADYAALRGAAGDWTLPTTVRAALTVWQFDAAETQMGGLRRVLARRDELTAAVAATDAGLQLPTNLRAAFEQGDVTAALSEAATERAIIDQVVAAARAARDPAAGGLLGRVGLLGQDPSGELAAARSSFAHGDLAAAQAGAIDARNLWVGAADLGGFRLRMIVAFVLVGLGVLIVGARLRPRPSRPRSD